MEESLFPVFYKGKSYEEKDCDDSFLGFYHSRNALNYENMVYMFDGMWVAPDGYMLDLEEY